MTFLPIVERELRVAGRRHATYSFRLWIALAAIILGVLFYGANTGAPKHILARRIFDGLAALALFYCLIAGRRATADCLSEEKREGTLGLLFLTDLKGYDVVLGKLFATSLNGFFCLLAIFPVLAVPLLMGGITNGEFWRMVLVLLDTILLSLAIGVFASALSWNARRATGANFLLLLLFMALPAAIGGMITYFYRGTKVLAPLFFSCPVYTFYLSSAAAYKWEPEHFWFSLAVIHILTWLLVAWASWLAPGSWQDRAANAKGLRRQVRWQAWAYGAPPRRRALRRQLLSVNAFYWLAARAWFKPVGVWLGLAFVACWWLYMLWAVHFSWLDESFCLTTAFFLNVLFKLWIGVESCQRLADDHKNGALELLLTTSLTVRQIVGGQLLALRRQFLGPISVAIVVELILVIATAQHSFGNGGVDLTFGIGGLVLLTADLAALIGLAMCQALTARTPNRASVSTFFRLLILPTVVFGALSLLVLYVTINEPNRPGWNFYVVLWLGLGIAADLIFGLPAWWQLKTSFRKLAVSRFAPQATSQEST